MRDINSLKKVAILGVGLMGGSFALGLKKRFPFLELYGYSRSRASYLKLKRLRIVDKISMELEEVVKEADLVVLSLPIYVIIEYLKKISPYLKEGAIVLDLGSTKSLIEKAAFRYLPKGVTFIGCHPLCGGERSGAEFSSSSLYEGAICIITTLSRKGEVLLVKKLWQALGAKVKFLSPREHDRFLSLSSHLAHLISFSLVNSLSPFPPFCPPSLRDMTRVASSSANLWTDIFLSNRKNILKDLRRFLKALEGIKTYLEKRDREKLLREIAKANYRCRFLQ